MSELQGAVPTATVALLLGLYVIQAVPMGISAALPLSLQGRGASYSDLAVFAFTSLPFTLKLFWAPVVDTSHLPGHGRRKSWLVPVQLLCVALMVVPAWLGWPSQWAGEQRGESIRIGTLTLYFFLLYVLMATQDVAVDGWALEMLPPHMKKHASTCNTIGQSFGFYVTNIAFLLFNHSREVNASSNKLLARLHTVNISLNAFLGFWGFVILGLTLYVAWYVPELPCSTPAELVQVTPGRSPEAPGDLATPPRVLIVAQEGPCRALKASYVAMAQMLGLAPVRLATFLLLLCRIPFGPIDSSGGLKMLELGCEKEILALLAPAAFPVGILTSYLTGHWINERFTAMRAFKFGYCCRLMLCVLWLGIYKLAQLYEGGQAPRPHAALIVYGAILVGIVLQTVATEIMFVSQMAFFAQVADTTMGGTYMTFFNTVANLGNKWPGFVSLALMDLPPFLTRDMFVDLTLVAMGVGLLMAFPLGAKLVERIEHISEAQWHLELSRSPSVAAAAAAAEDLTELIKVTDEGQGRLGDEK